MTGHILLKFVGRCRNKRRRNKIPQLFSLCCNKKLVPCFWWHIVPSTAICSQIRPQLPTGHTFYMQNEDTINDRPTRNTAVKMCLIIHKTCKFITRQKWCQRSGSEIHAVNRQVQCEEKESWFKKKWYAEHASYIMYLLKPNDAQCTLEHNSHTLLYT